MSGRYIGLEGVEGAGKTTVAASLRDALRAEGKDVIVVREPGGTDLGEEIRRLLLHSGDMSPWAEAALFAAQRAQLAAEVVRPALERGTWVVSDRTYYSSLAYQGGARGLGVDRVRALNEAALDGVLPDLVVVLDVDPRIGLGRQTEADRIGATGEDFQRRVSETYHALAASDPAVVLVRADGQPDEIAEDVLRRTKESWES
jgi:dTMP kinase